jgi:hypothetical protein
VADGAIDPIGGCPGARDSATTPRGGAATGPAARAPEWNPLATMAPDDIAAFEVGTPGPGVRAGAEGPSATRAAPACGAAAAIAPACATVAVTGRIAGETAGCTGAGTGGADGAGPALLVALPSDSEVRRTRCAGGVALRRLGRAGFWRVPVLVRVDDGFLRPMA